MSAPPAVTARTRHACEPAQSVSVRPSSSDSLPFSRSSSDSVSAQGFPPNPPTIYYGTVTASVPNGAAVIAVVRAGSSSATCGAGKVLLDGSQRVYAVQVITHSQRAGCGDTGRTVSFYVTPPSATEGGKLSNESPSWTDCLGSNQCTTEVQLTFGSSLTVRGNVPLMASDGASF